jgi:hypothetical protein
LSGQNQHIGTWVLNGIGGEKVVLELRSDQTMILEGLTYQYSIEDGNIVVADDYGIYYYPYTVSNNRLILIYPDGTEVIFERSGKKGSTESAAGTVSSSSGKVPSTDKLTGKWIYRSQEGTLILEFLSDNRLTFNGETTTYRMTEGAIEAQTDYGWQNYPYSLAGNKLNLTFPEGITLTFEKQETMQGSTGLSTNKGGRLWQLKGSLCYWSGSSSSYGEYSSYSRTERLSFDGKGNFMYGTEASFDSNTAMLYSDNPDVERGSYEINGNKVYLHFLSGGVIEVDIYMQQNNGMITELKYGEKLYATSLCE